MKLNLQLVFDISKTIALEATIKASKKYLSARFVFSFYNLKNGMSHF